MDIKWIIFSKNRAAQLDALLRSIYEYYPECDYTIIYKSDLEYLGGYVKLFNTFPNADIRKESNFREDVFDVLTEPYTGFLMDDMMFIDRFTGGKEWDLFDRSHNIAALSLRLHPGINFSYVKDMPIFNPFTGKQDLYLWEWRAYASYWGYPMSLDGHIFRTQDLVECMEVIGFDNPNQLEGMLASYPIQKKFMLCYESAKVVNYPLNLVQDVCKNRNMHISLKELNDNYMKGKRIKLMKPAKHNSCHVAQNIEWI